jgi:hypothetical protein
MCRVLPAGIPLQDLLPVPISLTTWQQARWWVGGLTCIGKPTAVMRGCVCYPPEPAGLPEPSFLELEYGHHQLLMLMNRRAALMVAMQLQQQQQWPP